MECEGFTEVAVPAPSEYPPGRRIVGPVWRGLRHWLKRYTFAPLWLPERWRYPAIGYLLGIALVGVAVGCDLIILSFLPDFDMPGLLVLLAILLTALGWGAGPSFVATLMAVVLVDVFDIAPRMVVVKHLT